MEELNPKRPSLQKRRRNAPSVAAVLCLVVLSGRVVGQSGGYSQATSESGSGAAQISLPAGQSPFSGSVPQGKATPEALPLTFQDAIDLGLKNNLGGHGRRWMMNG